MAVLCVASRPVGGCDFGFMVGVLLLYRDVETVIDDNQAALRSDLNSIGEVNEEVY